MSGEVVSVCADDCLLCEGCGEVVVASGEAPAMIDWRVFRFTSGPARVLAYRCPHCEAWTDGGDMIVLAGHED